MRHGRAVGLGRECHIALWRKAAAPSIIAFTAACRRTWRQHAKNDPPRHCLLAAWRLSGGETAQTYANGAGAKSSHQSGRVTLDCPAARRKAWAVKNFGKGLALATCAGLNACSMMTPGIAPEVHKISLNGESYSLTQLTASTWTAIASGASKSMNSSAGQTAGLRQAIEKTSGCKVTDSDYSQAGRQFDAQVDCGRLSR